MTRTTVKTVSIASSQDVPQTKGQKAFNTLIKQIETQRAVLADWEAVVPRFQQKYGKEMLPLVSRIQQLRCTLVLRLDQACEQKGLTKPERRKVSNLIARMAAELIGTIDEPDLKPIYNKHSQSDYDAEEQDALESMKGVLAGVMGLDLGDELDELSPEELMHRAQAMFDEQQAQDDAASAAQEARNPACPAPPAGRCPAAARARRPRASPAG